MNDRFYIGIDVGTGSARAGLFSVDGQLLANEKRDITMWKPQPDFVQQSSDDIWTSICHCVKAVVDASGVAPEQIKGLGFDATCSLVVLDEDHRPLTVSPDNAPGQNIIVWMDHRAQEDADFINDLKHEVLEYVGGRISPEMETPKLRWLKRNMPETWSRAKHFFDLPDFLTFRATGDATRSLCSTVCKWTYLGHESTDSVPGTGKWDRSYFEQIGLEDLVEEDFRRLGTKVRPMGEAIGQGLTPQAAQEFGLVAGTAVGGSIIDAHAGGIGMIGVKIDEEPVAFDKRLALIGGTSSCHMAVSQESRFIDGIWGPYYSAMIPDLWLNEGGQSATGALVDHIIFNHHQSNELLVQAKQQGMTPYEWLNHRLVKLAGDQPLSTVGANLHVCPYFHGNRSPRADATLRGMVSGLKLSNTLDDLACLYLATVDAIAYGTRHIIESMNDAGYSIDTIIACGGGTKNPVFMQEHADITGCRIVLPEEEEAVLVGAAILGAVASGAFSTIPEAMVAMSRIGRIIEPNVSIKTNLHDKKYLAFHELYATQKRIREFM